MNACAGIGFDLSEDPRVAVEDGGGRTVGLGMEV